MFLPSAIICLTKFDDDEAVIDQTLLLKKITFAIIIYAAIPIP